MVAAFPLGDPVQIYTCRVDGCHYTASANYLLIEHVAKEHVPPAVNEPQRQVKAALEAAKKDRNDLLNENGLTDLNDVVSYAATAEDFKPAVYTNVTANQEQKRAVTREQYDRARTVLDALPAGYYVKCAGCSGWYQGGTFVNPVGGGGPLCKACR